MVKKWVYGIFFTLLKTVVTIILSPFTDCETTKVAVTNDVSPNCATPVNSFRNAESCCKLCVRVKAQGCAWIPKSVAEMVHNIPRDICTICTSGFDLAGGTSIPGFVVFVPN